jgi:excinuclease UvrABC nuclease subunit
MAREAALLSMRTPTAERTALYRVYDGQDALLYIGVSNDFGTRWKSHARNQPWWPEVRRQTVTWYESRDEALAEEAAAIKAEHPRFNTVHNRDPYASRSMTREELLALPVSVDLTTAGRAFGVAGQRR